MNQLAAVFLSIAVLSGILFGLGQFSGGNLLTGSFYKMDNASDLESQYNSIDWNETSEGEEYAGSIYFDSFDNLNITEVSTGNRTVNSSSEKVLKFSTPANRSANISFSEDISGAPAGNLSLNKTSDLKLRLRENISLQVETINKTYSKDIKVHIPNKTSSVNQTAKDEVESESTMNKSQNNTAPLVLNLSNNTNQNITSADSVKLINNKNYTVKIEANSSNIINETKSQIRGNRSLTLNISDRKAIRVRAENRTRHNISYIESYNSSTNGSSKNSYAKNSTDTKNKTEKKHSSTQNITSNVNTNEEESKSSVNLENTSQTNSTKNVTFKEKSPEKGGEWVKIKSERVENFYIFKYEASRKDANSTNEGDNSSPFSQSGVKPWNEVNQSDASTACRRLGENYSLPSAKQWQTAATSGKSNNKELRGNTKRSSAPCETYSDGRARNLCRTGTGPSRWTNSAGVIDMVGNLWEWTSSSYDLSELNLAGESGYITKWNSEDSLPEEISENKSNEFGNSYFYASPEGVKAVRKGGGIGMSTKSGKYSTLIDRNPNYESKSIGFRCVYNP